MIVEDDISLREYLHLLATRVKDPPCIDRYDEFLIKVWDFFNLRVAAECYYDTHRYVAHSRHGALPISWKLLRDTWQKVGPPEQLITLIAKRNHNDVQALLGKLRKVLNRVRQKVSISRVQQVDAHCLRWLTRQPGRTAAEKGGARQEILGIVRVENYNTLENRVLKDFLWRCIGLAMMYLRRYDGAKYHDHVNIRAVARFKSLCIGGLLVSAFEDIGELREFPQPNYVLQQDRFYSKIWASYCDIFRQEDIAEKLWNRRAEIDDLYDRCTSGINMHCSPFAKYCTPLWVNPLDGSNEILENPIWENELAEYAIEEPEPPHDEVQTIDFTFPWDNRTELVYPRNHRNARPFIQNPHCPSKEPGETVSLHDILRKKDGNRLPDYFRQLHGLLGGSRWIILVPDDWEPDWLEQVIRSALTRDKVFLLWRSVAAALGMMEQREFKVKDSLVVADGFAVPSYNAVELRFIREPQTGRILPQRSSTRLHGEKTRSGTDVRFMLNRPFSDQAAVYDIGSRTAQTQRLGVGRLSSVNFVSARENFMYTRADRILFDGVRRFLSDEAKGRISYFDERDALSLVVQNRAEEVEFKTLVEHDECSPGGKPYRGKLTRGGALQMGATRLALNLLEGEQRDDQPLKEMQVILDQKTPEDTAIFFEATMTPGQGLASVLFRADFLKKPLPLDLTKLEMSENTKARIEREMKRHFPPVMPYVEANEDIWLSVKAKTEHYLQTGRVPMETGLFYHPQPYCTEAGAMGQMSLRLFGQSRTFDPSTMSPVDRLKRENVFGNAPRHEYPEENFDWPFLFQKLADDYRRGRNVLRMIAWTYQYKNNEFEFIRSKLHSKYVRCAQTLTAVEYTFCSNCFDRDDVRIMEILCRALDRIAGGVAGEDEYRLVYNLLQFHPETIEHIGSDVCVSAFMHIYREYNTYSFIGKDGYLKSAQATKLIGYYLKCMLFLLHRRRYDPGFLLRSADWQPHGFLSQTIPVRRLPSGQEYPAQRAHEQLRVSFLNYVRGHGTIDGIPLGD